jgi:vancomycin resistance protein YoaR
MAFLLCVAIPAACPAAPTPGAPARITAPAPSGAAHVVLGRAITALDVSDAGSRDNIRMAARRLAALEVPPQGEFHFLEALRVRGGVPEAPGRALIDGAAVHEAGGGLCQVSGTVHAAALRAGLGVIERSGHSAAVRTLPPGLDAAVSQSGGTDLVLWNGYRFPVRLELRVRGATLEATWSATSPGVPARVGRDGGGALVRRLPDGREELLMPAPGCATLPGRR